MALINHAKKEINAKIVYFGPAGSGKSTALQYIFSRIKPALRGELKSIPAGGDNLLFFDFSPFDGPLRDGYRVRLHVYTLTGPVTNPATWKMTLKGADGLIIMVDASPDRISAIHESISQLRDFLSAYGVGLHDTPAVLQLNRFEREQIIAGPEQLAASINLADLPCCVSCAASGEGVLEALTALSKLVLDRVDEKDVQKDGCRDEGVREPLPEDTDDALELSPDALVNEANQLSQVTISQTQAGASPTASLVCPGVSEENGVIRIPLDVSYGGTNHRLIVKVFVNLE
jgi:signal recognition particle receptor subunit beta